MLRFFHGNFDFEHRLADPAGEPSANLKRLNAELASSWLAMAEDGDLVWTPLPVDADFFRQAARDGLPKVVPVTSLADVPAGTQCVSWGWSTEIKKLAARFDWQMDAPSDEAVLFANSRSTSEELERNWNVGVCDARRIETLDQFQVALRAQNPGDRWVVKAMFSMSARERILGCGPATDADVNWVRRRLASQGAVFFEPWVDRIEEIGIQIDVPQAASPRLIGVTPMHVNSRGQYAGSGFASCSWGPSAKSEHWAEAIEVALRAATHLQSYGYFGPLGIDAMSYRAVDGSVQIRPLQDINARWTMGRLSLELQRLLKPGELGFWQHGSKVDAAQFAPFEVNRIIQTSPDRVGDEPCRYASKILIGTASVKVT